MSVNNSNTAGKVEKADRGQAHDFGRALSFGVLGVLIVALLVAFSIGTAYAQGTGKALDFADGIDEYVEVVSDFNIGTEYTMEAWFYADTLPTGVWQGIVTNIDADHGIWTLGDKIDYYVGGSHLSSTSISTGTWYHVAIVYSGGSGWLYIDGRLDPNFPVSLASPSITGIYVGSSVWVGEDFDGRIDEVRVWNVARTQEQIRECMCKKLTGTLPSALKGYWRFDEGEGATAYDETSNGNDGDLTGHAPTWVWSGAAIGDTSTYTTTGSLISITTPNSRGEATVTNIGGSPDIVQLYRVDNNSYADWPSAGPSVPGGRDHFDPMTYWGVFMSGGTSPDFDFKLDLILVTQKGKKYRCHKSLRGENR